MHDFSRVVPLLDIILVPPVVSSRPWGKLKGNVVLRDVSCFFAYATNKHNPGLRINEKKTFFFFLVQRKGLFLSKILTAKTKKHTLKTENSASMNYATGEIKPSYKMKYCIILEEVV